MKLNGKTNMIASLTTVWLLSFCVCVSGNLLYPNGCKYWSLAYCDECSDGFYMEEAGVCKNCSANCSVCSSDSECTKCDNGHFLQRKYKDEQFCQPCAEGCSICSSAQVCFKCEVGYFQNNHNCRRCSIDCEICKSENECLQCKDGYRQFGDLCYKCPEEFYYINSACIPCPLNCASCLKFDECMKCKPGFFGSFCTHKCSSGCIANVCEQSNGQCPCKVNFLGKACDECKPGYFGDNCERNCSKSCMENSCYRETGNCYKCKAYFKLPTCTKCVDGKWGEDCRMDCPDNCHSCLSPTECTRCKDRYHGGACEKNCSDGCSLRLCEQTTGICSQNCTKMFMGQYCDQCIEGSYGKDDCSEECPKNCYNNVCDMIDGRCNEGCKPRFYGPNCDLQCPDSCKLCSSNTSCQDCAVGFWGDYCQNQCPKNCLNNTCLSNGKCTLCTPGYSGNHCNVNCSGSKCNMSEIPTEDDSFLSNKVGSVIILAAVFVLITSAVTITIILVNKRKNQKREQRVGEVTYSQVREACKQREHRGIVYTKPHTEQKRLTLVDKKRNGACQKGVPSTSEDHTRYAAAENIAEYDIMELMHFSSGPNAKLQIEEIENKTNDGFERNQELADHVYCNTDEVTKRRIPLNSLQEFVQNKTRRNYIEEFKQLPEGLIKPCIESQKKENILKNRYRGVYPYDSRRVILRNLESNYINASYIDGFRKQKAYIASMGPTTKQMGEDFLPFWNMIWQENVSTIVMLTNLRESGVQKCDKYWPGKGLCARYGDVKVTCQSEEVYTNYTARFFSLEKTDKRTLRHMHFTAWPDKATPKHVSSLVEFWVKVNDIAILDDGPVVVHCSAGVGRTGTFIALDMLVNEGMSEGHIDIFGCVRNLREERVSLVQTVDQYIFLHKALAQLLSPDSEVTI